MKPKELIEMFPYGYTRLRNHNGSIALTLDTPCAEAYVFVERIRKSKMMPQITQRQMDLLQVEFGKSRTIIDWFDNDDGRYFITTQLGKNPADYQLVLNASFGEDFFEVRGTFFEREHVFFREKVFNERYRKDLPSDAFTTQADFTEERYDIIFPDDPLSHCRRLANVVVMNAFLPTELYSRKIENYDNPNSESLEDNNDDNIE